MVFLILSLILSVHSGNDSLDVPFPSMIRFQSDCSNEGRDGRQRRVKICGCPIPSFLCWVKVSQRPPSHVFSSIPLSSTPLCYGRMDWAITHLLVFLLHLL